jgi:hypothetical protein
MKKIFLGIVLWFILIVMLVIVISTIRSTKETYVCVGSHKTPGTQAKQVAVGFKIENNYPGLPWLDKNWANVTFSPMENFNTIYASNNRMFGGAELTWSEDVWGRNVSIFVHSGPGHSILDFKFDTKILNVIHYENNGNTRRSEYNLVCSVAK